MVDLKVKGAEDFYRASKALKSAGETELRKELTAGMKTGAKPLIGKAKASALRSIPKRGGLAALVAREPMRVQVRTGAKTAGVRIVVGKRRGAARATNAGLLRHPVFGNRQVFVEQPVPQARGWFDDEMTRQAPSIRPELERALVRVLNKIVREAR